MIVIAVDFDMTLWNEDKKQVIVENVKKVRELFYNYQNTIIIYTSRDWNQAKYIIDVLRSNNIPFHALCCEKLRADKYIDDRMEKW